MRAAEGGSSSLVGSPALGIGARQIVAELTGSQLRQIVIEAGAYLVDAVLRAASLAESIRRDTRRDCARPYGAMLHKDNYAMPHAWAFAPLD